MIPIYAPEKLGHGEFVPPAIVPPASIVVGQSKHNTVFDGTYIWIANSGSSTVFRYNINTLEFNEFNTGCFIATGVAYDGTNIWVTGFRNNTIAKLSPTGAVLGNYNPITSPANLGYHQIISAGADVFVTAYWGGKVLKLASDGSLSAQVTLGQYPLGIVELGDHVYVTCFDFTTSSQGNGKVVKLLKTDLSIVSTWNIGVNPSDITTDGTNLWITAFAGGYVYKVNPADGAILATYNTGIANAYQTTIRHIGNGWNLLAITVSKDYQGDNLAGTYNKVHFLNRGNGTSFQVSDTNGIDLRNGSLDSLNWVWFGGYADGSVTRIPLTTPTPPPTLALTVAAYSTFDNRIYAYERASGKLYIFSANLALLGSIQTPWVKTISGGYENFGVTASGKVVFNYYASGSTFTTHYYDIASGSFNSYSSLNIEPTDIFIDGNDVYITTYNYSASPFSKLNTNTGVWTNSVSLGVPSQTAICKAAGFFWVTTTGLSKTTAKLHKVSSDMGTLLATYDIPTSGNRQVQHCLVFAGGRLWFSTYATSGDVDSKLRSFNVTTDVFETYNIAVSSRELVVLGDYLYFSLIDGVAKFSTVSNSIVAMLGSPSDKVQTSTQTQVISINNSTLSAVA